MADGSIRINTKIDKKGAEKGLVELKKTVDTKVKQLEKGVNSAGNEVTKLNEKFNQTSQELANVEQQMDLVGDRVFETYRDFQGMMPEKSFDEFIQSQIQADAEYTKLVNKQQQLKTKVDEYKTKLDASTGKHKQLNTSLAIAKKEQSEVNTKLEEAKKKAAEHAEKMKEASKNTKKTSVDSLGISKGIGAGIKKLAKYAVILIGFESIYGMLRNSMTEWLNGGSKEAKQLQADITNLKANIGAALAPAIQSVLQIFYKILAVVGAIVKSFANINIFARNTAKSTASTASSTKAASNNLAKFDDLDVLQKDSGADSGGISPTDLSALMAQYDSLAEKIKNIFAFIFEPFKKAWETTGQTVISSIHNAFYGLKNLFGAIGSSFANIWTNGTAQTTGELLLKIFADILNIIGNISIAFANAWNEEGRGTAIVQSLANAFNNVLGIIEGILGTFSEWWKTDKAQTFADSIVSIFEIISGWVENLTANLKKIWDNGRQHAFTSLLDAYSNIIKIFEEVLKAIDPLVEGVENLLGNALDGLFSIIGDIIDGFNSMFDAITSVDGGLEAITIVASGLAIAMGVYWVQQNLATIALGAWNTITTIATAVTGAFSTVMAFLTSPVTLVILAITALIAIIVLLVKNWDTLSAALSAGWEWIKQKAIEIFGAIGNFFSTIWNAIKTTISNVITGIYNGIVNKFNEVKNFVTTLFTTIKTTVSNIWNSIKTSIVNVITNIVNGVRDKFNNMKTNITNIFNNIKNSVVNIFNNIKNSLVNVVSNMWSAIKNKFSTLGSAIGDAISGAVKSAVNWILTKIENVINNFFRLINTGIDVINAITGVSIGKLNMLSIPKLAKGGIVNQPTQAIIGEAGKEAVLPLENNTEWMDILAGKIAAILGASSNNDSSREIVIKFDGTLAQLIRVLKPELDRESNRRGDKLIVGGVL